MAPTASAPSDRLTAAQPKPPLRLGVLVVPDAPFPTLAERWRRVEDLGFDFLFVADHYRHTGDAALP